MYIIANNQRKGKRERERESGKRKACARVRESVCGEMESQQGAEHGAQQTERIRNVKNTMVCVNIDRANRAVFLPMCVCVCVCLCVWLRGRANSLFLRPLLLGTKTFSKANSG